MKFLIAKIYVFVLDFLERLVEFSGVTSYGKFTILRSRENALTEHSQGSRGVEAQGQKGL
jgi:hypothetical protein